MNIPERYIVICEGKSDRAYLLALQSLLDGTLCPPEGWEEAPVRFIPRPEPSGVTTGYYDEVLPAYQKERRSNPKAKVMVWVDSDVYIWNTPRKGKGNGDAYTERDREKIPAFYFSYHKFEDYLAMHSGPAVFRKWKSSMIENGHLRIMPLSHKDYSPAYQKVFPHYSKSSLPNGIVCEKCFANLKQNCSDPDILAAKELYADGHSFAEFLVNILEKYYPTMFEEGLAH